MLLIDTLYKILHKEITTVISVRQHLQMFCCAIGDIREEVTPMPFEGSEHLMLLRAEKGTLIKQLVLLNALTALKS
jgi:hypothetical protein